LARVCLSPRDRERIWLAGFHHSGDTVSAACLKELVRAAEAQTRIRARRRTELVQQRLDMQTRLNARTRRLMEQQRAKLTGLRHTQTSLTGKGYHAEQLRKGPISRGKSALLKVRRAAWRKRLHRLKKQIAECERLLAKHQTRWVAQEAALAELHTWHAQLEADNRTNPDPPPEVEARMDAGFAFGEHLTWLLEMGYYPNTKAPNGQTTRALRAQLPRPTEWVRVGDNAEMTLIGA